MVEERVQEFATELPIRIIDREVDVLPADAAGPDHGVVSGFNYPGRIHMVCEGLADSAAVLRTLRHELLHYGLRRFLTRAEYIARLNDLYQRDAWIRREADAWVGSADAYAPKRTSSPQYIRARGVHEALAKLAETEGDYRNNVANAKATRTVALLIAALAEHFGFTASRSALSGGALAARPLRQQSYIIPTPDTD